MSAGKRRAFRYEVAETGGAGAKAVGDSPYILDWKYMGREYTWNIVGGPPRFKSTGYITGKYIDRGYVIDGEFVSDKEAA